MLKNIAFFPTKRAKITGLSTLKVGGGDNLLLVPTLLSGIVVPVQFDQYQFAIHNRRCPDACALIILDQKRKECDLRGTVYTQAHITITYVHGITDR